MDLAVSTAWHNHVATLTVSGELDYGSQTLFEKAIDQALQTAGASGVTVDLSGLSFIDSSGIGVLLKGRRVADRVGIAYRVTAPAGIVRQVLTLSGVLQHLTRDTA